MRDYEIFAGLTDNEYTDAINAINAGEYTYSKHAMILQAGDVIADVRANENCRVMFLNVRNIGGGSWALKIMRSLMNITARKNLHLSERSFINANRSIRRKVMSYLHSVSLKTHSREIAIPFDRQQMADYLNTDRSALSKELCAMRDEGIIEFHRNKFLLK